MPHFMIVFILYLNLLNHSWTKNVYFEEYGAFDILDKYGKRLCSNDTPKGFCRHFVKGELLAE